MARLTLALALGLFIGAPVFGQTGQPPPVSILQSGGQLAPGFVFITPASGPGASNAFSNGPEIIDNLGRPVWFTPLTGKGLASDFRIQTYQGNPVLTWSQGVGFQNVTPGATTDYIADSTYHVIATVQAGNGLDADQHEFYLTPQNTALITSYNITTGDLTSVGGPASGPIFEGVAQEIDVATGTVLLEWHSLDHVALTESYEAYTPGQTTPFDYFHINSVSVDTDGNLLVSSRHTWTVYKLNRTSGAVLWRLGGKKSDFALGAGLPFAWQHDAVAVDASTIRIFDNESDGAPQLPASRVIWVHHDDAAMTASVAQSIHTRPGCRRSPRAAPRAFPTAIRLWSGGSSGGFRNSTPRGRCSMTPARRPALAPTGATVSHGWAIPRRARPSPPWRMPTGP